MRSSCRAQRIELSASQRRRIAGAIFWGSACSISASAKLANAEPVPNEPIPDNWTQSALREEYTVDQWQNGCGPRPQSRSEGGGESVAVHRDDGELVIAGGGRVYRTDQCYDTLPGLVRGAHARDPSGSSWRTRCVSPPGDPRRTELSTTLSLSPARIDILETGRYQITIHDGLCIATVKRTRSLVVNARAHAAQPTAPQSSAEGANSRPENRASGDPKPGGPTPDTQMRRPRASTGPAANYGGLLEQSELSSDEIPATPALVPAPRVDAQEVAASDASAKRRNVFAALVGSLALCLGSLALYLRRRERTRKRAVPTAHPVHLIHPTGKDRAYGAPQAQRAESTAHETDPKHALMVHGMQTFANAPRPEMQSCPRCGQRFALPFQHCPHDGARLHPATATLPLAATSATPRTSRSVADTRVKICPTCSALFDSAVA
jgi:hypothetical protein